MPAVAATPKYVFEGQTVVATPNVTCIGCKKSQTANPTVVADGTAMEWDPPKGWFAARYDNDKNRIIYVCGGCLNSIPFRVFPGT